MEQAFNEHKQLERKCTQIEEKIHTTSNGVTLNDADESNTNDGKIILN